MGRPPLDIGTYGEIYIWWEGTTCYARVQFRDRDGRTRPVRRSGKSETAAVRNLKKALAERIKVARGGSMTPDMRLSEMWLLWLPELQRQVQLRLQDPKKGIEETTYDAYVYNWRRYLEPRVGGVCGREMNATRAYDALSEISKVSTNAAKNGKTVLGGLCAWATIHGGMDANPVRDAGNWTPAKKDKAEEDDLDPEILLAWLRYLDGNPLAIRWDLPDLSKQMMGTGERVGEALAHGWDDYDRKTGKIRIWHRLVHVIGRGLVRKRHSKQGENGDRELYLPSWHIEMLERRRFEMHLKDLPTSGDVPIYPSNTGTWRDVHNVRAVLREVREGSPAPNLHPHLVRHAVSNILKRSGATVEQIAAQLGDTEEVVTKWYTRNEGPQAVNWEQAQMLGRAIDL